MRLLFLGCLAAVATGEKLSVEFAEVAKGLEKVWTLGVVGPRLESEVLVGTFGDRTKGNKESGCVLKEDVVLVECRDSDVDLSDANRLSANAVGTMACADGLVYVVQESEARQSPRFLSGLVAGFEASLRTGRRGQKMVVIAVAGPSVDRSLVQEIDRFARDAWSSVSKPRGFTTLPPPKFVVVRAQDVDAVFGSSISRSLREFSSEEDDESRRAVDIAKVLATATPTMKGKKATKMVIPKRKAVELFAGSQLADAVDALFTDGGFIDAAKDNLARRFDDKFCETYADECDLVAGDALDRFDDAASSVAEAFTDGNLDDVEATDSYARKRAQVKDIVLGKLDDAFLDSQLQYLARETARHLRTGLKNLRISKSMSKQTQSLLKDADAYFVSKASAAFGPNRPWKAKQKDVYEALNDFITERLQVARLQGTYLPDSEGTGLSRFWPFPINFAFHWLLPSFLGIKPLQSKGLTKRDMRMLNVGEFAPPAKLAIGKKAKEISQYFTQTATGRHYQRKPPEEEWDDY